MSLDEAFIWLLLDGPAGDGGPGFCAIGVGFSTGDLQPPVLGLTLQQPLTALRTTHGEHLHSLCQTECGRDSSVGRKGLRGPSPNPTPR